MSYMHLTNIHGDTEEDFTMFRGHLTRKQCESLMVEQEMDADHWDGENMYHGFARNVAAREEFRDNIGDREIRFSKAGRGAFKVTILGVPTYGGSEHTCIVVEEPADA